MSDLKQEHFCVDGKEYVVNVRWYHPDRSGLRKCWIDKREFDALPFVVYDVEEFARAYLFPGLVWLKPKRELAEMYVYDDFVRSISHWGYLCAVAGSGREGEKGGVEHSTQPGRRPVRSRGRAERAPTVPDRANLKSPG